MLMKWWSRARAYFKLRFVSDLSSLLNISLRDFQSNYVNEDNIHVYLTYFNKHSTKNTQQEDLDLKLQCDLFYCYVHNFFYEKNKIDSAKEYVKKIKYFQILTKSIQILHGEQFDKAKGDLKCSEKEWLADIKTLMDFKGPYKLAKGKAIMYEAFEKLAANLDRLFSKTNRKACFYQSPDIKDMVKELLDEKSLSVSVAETSIKTAVYAKLGIPETDEYDPEEYKHAFLKVLAKIKILLDEGEGVFYKERYRFQKQIFTFLLKGYLSSYSDNKIDEEIKIDYFLLWASQFEKEAVRPFSKYNCISESIDGVLKEVREGKLHYHINPKPREVKFTKEELEPLIRNTVSQELSSLVRNTVSQEMGSLVQNTVSQELDKRSRAGTVLINRRSNRRFSIFSNENVADDRNEDVDLDEQQSPKDSSHAKNTLL